MLGILKFNFSNIFGYFWDQSFFGQWNANVFFLSFVQNHTTIDELVVLYWTMIAYDVVNNSEMISSACFGVGSQIFERT